MVQPCDSSSAVFQCQQHCCVFVRICFRLIDFPAPSPLQQPQISPCFSTNTHLFLSLCSSPPLLDVVVVGTFLQPPGLPLLRGGVIAVVVQQEGPHLATDGWVNATEEDGLAASKQTTVNAKRSNRGCCCGQGEQTVHAVLQNAAQPNLLEEKQTLYNVHVQQKQSSSILRKCLGHSLTATESFR